MSGKCGAVGGDEGEVGVCGVEEESVVWEAVKIFSEQDMRRGKFVYLETRFAMLLSPDMFKVMCKDWI